MRADATADLEDGPPTTTPSRQVRRHSSLSAAMGGLSVSTLRTASGGDPLMRLAPPPRWMLFNDFVITETPASEAQAAYGGQKTPCMLYYTRVRTSLKTANGCCSTTLSSR